MDRAEQELIERVFQFSDCTARTIMTPRTDIFAVPIDLPFDQVVQQVMEAGYSRVPVYQGSLDTIAGILYAKDVLHAALERPDAATGPDTLARLLRPPTFVLEHQRIASVLKHFKQTRMHLALVLDEYGQIDGLVTLEDVLEELTGDIADEYDEADTRVTRRTDGSFLVDGRISYADAEAQLGLPSRSGGPTLAQFDTLAGLLLALLEHIPTTGETVIWQDWSFEVVDMDGVRIDKILVRPPHPLDAQT
jgi:putative hemolysin